LTATSGGMPMFPMPVVPVFDFVAEPQAVQRWRAQDDRVMGGVTLSRLAPGAGSAVFEGSVSLERNGGFASVRTEPFAPPLDLAAAAGVALLVRGDGRRYKLILRDDESSGAVSFMAGFDTRPGELTVVRLPFDAFRATFRGRSVAGTLRPQAITSLGLMLSKVEHDGVPNAAFAPGAFRLEVLAIGAMR